jgi:DNA polymerase-3 subunit delta
VALAARFGWSTADLCGDSPPPIDEWERKLQPDEGLRPEDGAFVRDAGRFAGEKNLQAAKDDVSALEALLERGLPPGHVLVIAAGKVDGRLPVVKRLAEAGCRITLAVKSEGTWDAKRPVLGPMLAEMLAGTEKSVNPDAEERLAALVGTDARALAAEVAKLAAFVGDRREIGIADVDAVVVRTASDPFFALGNAVEARDLAGALGVLRRGLADGASPHMWVGSLAGTIRRMLVEQERGRLAAGGKRLATFGDWSATVLPSIDPDELGDRKPYGLWMKYQAAVRFTRSELLDCLASLAEADHSMKTGSDGAVLVERCLVGLLRAQDRERGIA